MTVTIDVPDELASRLIAAGIHAADARRYAITALEEAVDNAEVREWWDRLSAQEREAEIAKTEASLADADSGRTSTAEAVYARVRTRHASEPTA